MGATPMTRKLRSCRAGMRKLNLSFRWCQNLSMHLLPSRVKVLFFTYGQTGTGKSHTMLGTDESFRDGWGSFPLLVRSQFTHVYPLGFSSGCSLNNRTTVFTQMNEAKGNLGGSSRSYCAMILTLYLLQKAFSEVEVTFSWPPHK